MTNGADAKLLQVLVREAREDRLVYLILAEGRLVLPEAQAPQPDHNVHDGALQSGAALSSAGEARVSRGACFGLALYSEFLKSWDGVEALNSPLVFPAQSQDRVLRSLAEDAAAVA